jgi:hypothetical protein
MHDTQAELNVGQKAAQMGFTEWALNVTFFNIDIKGVDCLYVLPAKTPDASDFSAARFDPALELSPHLATLFSDVQNIGHKRAGATNLYIRGSKSRAGLKSIPVGLIVLDEVDEMDQDNVPLAMERTSGQVEQMVLTLSTPTTPGNGINRLYRDTTQEHFFFRCPCCSRYTELVFPDCLEITAADVNDQNVKNSFYKCKECGGRLENAAKTEWLAKGKWIAEFSDRERRGFNVGQMYSNASAGQPDRFALAYLMSLSDVSKEQEFYNSKLGQPHVVDGSSVTDEDLERCIGSYRMGTSEKRGVRTLGVDVGTWINYEVDEWRVPGGVNSTDLNVQSRCRVLQAGKVKQFEELDGIMRQYSIDSCVIDANPERRKSYEFASRFYGLVKMCFYGQGVYGKQIHVGHEEEPTITVDRTSWMDLSLGRFRSNTIELPVNIPLEFKQHIKSPVRVYKEDRLKNQVGVYNKTENIPDHHAHARNYAEMALPFALSIGESENIEEVI